MEYRLQNAKIGTQKRSGTADLVEGRDLIVAHVKWSKAGWPRITTKWLSAAAQVRFQSFCESNFEADVLELLFEKKSREK